MSTKAAKETSELLAEWFPDVTPAERFAHWQEMNLELIENGLLVALLLPGGDILHKHPENCTDGELRRAMTPAQYRAWMQR